MKRSLKFLVISLLLAGCLQELPSSTAAPELSSPTMTPVQAPAATVSSPEASDAPTPAASPVEATSLAITPAASSPPVAPTAPPPTGTPTHADSTGLSQTVTPSASPTIPPFQSSTSPTIVSANVSIHFINVSFGEAVFIDSNDKDVLVDAGCRKCGEEVLAYLQKINAQKIDVLLPSNHDEDHMGGLILFLSRPDALVVWDSGSTKDTQVYSDYATLANQKNVTIVRRSQVFWLDNLTRVTVLNPVQPLEFTKENDNSIVLRVDVGSVSFLLAGDCELPCEQSILASGLALQVSVLKAGHHCSRTSTSEAFLDAVAPELAVCGVGVKGSARYGHPHPEVLSRFESRSIPYLITMLNGSVRIATDGRSYAVFTS